MEEGGAFVVHLEPDGVRLEPVTTAVARAQAIIREALGDTSGLVESLAADRRRAAEDK